METMRTKQKLRDAVLGALRAQCEPAAGAWEVELGEDGTATLELQGRRLVARVVSEVPDCGHPWHEEGGPVLCPGCGARYVEQETEILVLEL